MSVHLRLHGSEVALSSALDRIHIACDVRAVLELEGCIEVALAAPLADLLFEEVEVEVLPDPEGPELSGLEEDCPILLADDLLVRPPWVAPPEGFDGFDLVVPRGMAFGSGEHASTQAALLLMHQLWPDAAMSFADVGCGSGILAGYAQLRGASPIRACDLDPACVRATRELLPDAEVSESGPEELPAGNSDLVVANMNLGELRAALPAILALNSGRGWTILSGIQVDQEANMLQLLPTPPIAGLRCENFVALALGRRT